MKTRQTRIQYQIVQAPIESLNEGLGKARHVDDIGQIALEHIDGTASTLLMLKTLPNVLGCRFAPL